MAIQQLCDGESTAFLRENASGFLVKGRSILGEIVAKGTITEYEANLDPYDQEIFNENRADYVDITLGNSPFVFAKSMACSLRDLLAAHAEKSGRKRIPQSDAAFLLQRLEDTGAFGINQKYNLPERDILGYFERGDDPMIVAFKEYLAIMDGKAGDLPIVDITSIKPHDPKNKGKDGETPPRG